MQTPRLLNPVMTVGLPMPIAWADRNVVEVRDVHGSNLQVACELTTHHKRDLRSLFGTFPNCRARYFFSCFPYAAWWDVSLDRAKPLGDES